VVNILNFGEEYIMNYPDGSPIIKGDLIWFNEQTQIGRISFIVENAADLLAFDREEIGVFICFDVSGVTLTRDLFHGSSILADEGIRRLSDEEKLFVAKLRDKLNDQFTIPESELSYHVYREDSDNTEEGYTYNWMIRLCRAKREFRYSRRSDSFKEV
jgi:hypothetical protein